MGCALRVCVWENVVKRRHRAIGEGIPYVSDDRFEHHIDAALQTRPVIEQAKGILMGHRTESPDAAFAELVAASQQHNVKLVTLASALVHLAAGNGHLVDDDVREAIASQWRELAGDARASDTIG